MLRDKLQNIGRIVSLLLLVAVIGVLVVSFIRSKNKRVEIPPVRRGEKQLGDQVVAVTEGYQYVSSVNGRMRFKVIAAKDTSYVSGRHELEKLELTGYDEAGKESGKIRSDRGDYQQDKDQVSFDGNVMATNPEGLEVNTDRLVYDTKAEVARTDTGVRFKRHDLSGSSLGARLLVQEKKLALLSEAHVTIAPKVPTGLPVEIKGEKADYDQTPGVVRFTGKSSVVQGLQSGASDQLTGFYRGDGKSLERIEARGSSILKSEEKGRNQEILARDIDFFFDENQRLTRAVAAGSAVARSLEKDAPREVTAEKMDAAFTPQAKGSDLTTVVTDSRTVMKIVPTDKAGNISERVIEGDKATVNYFPGGKFVSRAEASGNAVMTITPLNPGPKSEKRILKAARFTADFFETGNAVKVFNAEGGATAEFIPTEASQKRPKKVLTGSKMAALFEQGTQDVTELTIDGNARVDEGERHGTAGRAIYNGSTHVTQMRTKPQVWDATARTDAQEIDISHDTAESFARGRVRTTYYSQETTQGAAPFRKSKAPVFVSADKSTFLHREAAAKYEGNARAWQDDNFVRGDVIEMDNSEKTMVATGNAQSAIYDYERKSESGQKETVPVFGAAARIRYFDTSKLVKYEGQVKIRQGTDQIDAVSADVVLDEDYRMKRFSAKKEVVLTQPSRIGKGDQLEYEAVSDEAVLTGNLAMIEDREHETVSKGARLTLHLRDAKITASDEGGGKRVRTTHRVIKRS